MTARNPGDPSQPPGTLLSLGHGYSARVLARRLLRQGWRVIGTTRRPEALAMLAAEGVEPLLWPDPKPAPGPAAGPDARSAGSPGAAIDAGSGPRAVSAGTGGKVRSGFAQALGEATHLLSSIPPGPEGDPVVAGEGTALAAARHLAWVGYLSTTGVYGDAGGGWVDEATPPAPSSPRAAARLAAEDAWGRVCAEAGVPLAVFRLAGIYGPGRSPFDRLRAGTARAVVKPGQVFSRIHVEDIAATLAAAMARPGVGGVFNLADDLPTPPEEVLWHAADLAGLARPPAVPFETAELSPMARSFYADSRRVRNARIKRDLGVTLTHPDYRAGLAAILAAEGAGDG